MKIHHIITEMAWINKFSTFEKHVRDTNMTLNELKNFLLQNYNIFIMFEKSRNSATGGHGGGGIGDLIATDDISAPPKLRGHIPLTIVLSPEIDGDTPVAEVHGLLGVLRHEISHALTDTTKDKRLHYDNYVKPSHNEGMYYIQPMERPAQALDMAEALAVVGMNPDQLEKIIFKVSNKIIKHIDEGIGPDVVESIVRRYIEAAIGIRSDGIINKIEKEGWEVYINPISSKIQHLSLLVALGKATKNDTDIHKEHGKHKVQNTSAKIRLQFNTFMKMVRSNFKKAKAYAAAHPEHKAKSLANMNKRTAELPTMPGDIDELLKLLKSIMQKE